MNKQPGDVENFLEKFMSENIELENKGSSVERLKTYFSHSFFYLTTSTNVLSGNHTTNHSHKQTVTKWTIFPLTSESNSTLPREIDFLIV